MNGERRDDLGSEPRDYQRSSQAWKPILIVGAVVLVIAVLSSRPDYLAQNETSRGDQSTFSDLAIMSGIKRTNRTSDFQSGEATAVMGGVDLDLRGSTMEGEEAVLDVSSVMGGVKIRVPAAWTVVPRVNTILGGFQDSTRHPQTDDHRLILKGTVVMGGLKVTN